jgi:hypothetical protein
MAVLLLSYQMLLLLLLVLACSLIATTTATASAGRPGCSRSSDYTQHWKAGADIPCSCWARISYTVATVIDAHG